MRLKWLENQNLLKKIQGRYKGFSYLKGISPIEMTINDEVIRTKMIPISHNGKPARSYTICQESQKGINGEIEVIKIKDVFDHVRFAFFLKEPVKDTKCYILIDYAAHPDFVTPSSVLYGPRKMVGTKQLLQSTLYYEAQEVTFGKFEERHFGL